VADARSAAPPSTLSLFAAGMYLFDIIDGCFMNFACD